MAPVLAEQEFSRPRVVCYHQTHYNSAGKYVSLLPLASECTDYLGITHLIIAAFHLNDPPGNITLNDDAPGHAKHDPLWEEVAIFQDLGVKVLGMLGGAAHGSFTRLDGVDDAQFELYYQPFQQIISRYHLDGLDLDVEESMSLAGIIRLIDRLKVDFGPDFLITMAPVATALQGRPHLSGFDYETLEVMRGSAIAWYNTQFYNNWGSLDSLSDYSYIMQRGWPMDKIVVGAITNPGNGHGFIPFEQFVQLVMAMNQIYPRFGGVMGWEYFNSYPGNESQPWLWAHRLGQVLQNR